MDIKRIVKDYGFELSLYLTGGAMILAAYLLIAKLMPAVMSCRVILN